MSNDGSGYSARAAQLRKEFDTAFASPRLADAGTLETILTLRIERALFAMRLSEIEGIARAPRIVPVPSSVPALLGLAGLRGAMLPVYSLPRLLHYDASEDVQWLLQCGQTEKLCLGLPEYLGCHRVSPESFTTAPAATAEQIVTLGAMHYTVIRTQPIMKSILNTTEGH